MLAVQEYNLSTGDVSHIHVNCFCKSLGIKDVSGLEKLNNSKFRFLLVESQDLPCYKCGNVIQDDTTIYVRPVKVGIIGVTYRMFRKIGRGKYEPHPDHLQAGFSSRARAERYARDMEM